MWKWKLGACGRGEGGGQETYDSSGVGGRLHIYEDMQAGENRCIKRAQGNEHTLAGRMWGVREGMSREE